MTATMIVEKNTVEPQSSREPARRFLIFANPKAGALLAGAGANGTQEASAPRRALECATETTTRPYALDRLAEAVRAAGLDARVEAIPDAQALPAAIEAAKAAGYDTIVAAGGDGTIRTVAQAMVGSTVRLGILPMGTDNNFAHSLGLPFELDAALNVLATGRERQVDVGKIGDEYFLEAAGVGLFADAIDAFGAEEPRKHQLLRLLKVIGPLWWNLRAHRLILTLDNVIQPERAILVTVANAEYLGAGMALAPGAGLSDGVFDVVIFRALTRWEMLAYAFAVLRGKHLEMAKAYRVQAKTVEIRRRRRFGRPLPVHADDHTAAYTPVRLEVVPDALRILVPVE